MKIGRVLRRLAVILVAAVLVLAIAGVGGAVYAVRKSFPQYSGEIRLAGLGASVDVYRDGYGIPQIYAGRVEDLFRAQGYLHAQDRFWEMDFRRHVTSGRLSELFGQSEVKTDAFIRTLGWRRTAEKEFGALAPETRQILQAYANGVNAYLDGHQGLSVSLEYGLVRVSNPGYRIEKWDPIDSIAWLKAMAWDLRSNLPDEISRANLLAHGLTRAQIEQLYPPYPQDRNAPILPSGSVSGGVFVAAAPAAGPSTGPSPSPAGASPAAGGSPAVGGGGSDSAAPGGDPGEVMAALPALLGLDHDGIGSNSWVVSGKRTTSGKPLLSNDPHLGPVMPSLWYQMGLHCTSVSAGCPYDVAGFTFSGVPGVMIGHNARIAWGFTNLGPDVADLYLEKVSGGTYESDGEKRPLTTRTETIKVAGGDDVTITVRSTVHGPLLSDRDSTLQRIGEHPDVAADGRPAAAAEKPAARYEVALRWTALDASRTADAIIGLNTASDWATFRAAARLFAVPSQNLVYADVDGNIGYQAPGAIPIRGAGDGRWPVPGWLSAYDWSGEVPFDELPSALNPPSDFIVTANQEVVPPAYPHFITGDWDYGWRSERIRTLLGGASGPVDVSDMERIQSDTWNVNAAMLVPALLAVPLRGDALRARDLLRGWDFSQPADSAAAAYFNAVWRALLQRTFWDDLPSDERPHGGGRWFEVIRRLLADPASSWWDDRRTSAVEDRDTVLAASLDAAARELGDRLGGDPKSWRWGELHTLELRNASLGESGIGPVEWLVNRGPVEAPGGGSVVNANAWDAVEGYEVSAVPSMRMVIDLADLRRSRWVNLTGNSGHAFHPDYTSQVELWRTGRTTPMPWGRPDSERLAKDHLTFIR
jgi:penicillin amidase